MGRDFIRNVVSIEMQESLYERNLGTQVQRDLAWDDHTSHVVAKVNYRLSHLKHLQQLLHRGVLRVFVEGAIMSHLRYGISVSLSGDIHL